MMNRMATCLVMATALASSGGFSRRADAQLTQPIVKVVDIFVNSVNVEQGELIADATVTLDIVGRTVTRLVEIPLTLSGTQGAAEKCDVLNLAVGPLDLNLLGLVVELDDCKLGPVMVDITAVAGDGQLLGNLLCAVAGLLDNGVELGDILGGLTSSQLGLLTDSLAGVLNGVFDQLLVQGVAAEPTTQSIAKNKAGNGGSNGGGKSAGHQCDILNLELDAIHLNVLGLQVDTSDICLDVYAVRGKGSLLGNLLCSLVNALNNTHRSPTSQLAQVKEILRLLNRLGL